MGATFLRLQRTGLVRMLVLSAATAVWFLLILVVVRGMGEQVEAQSKLFGGALMRGFGLENLVTPDALLRQMVGVSFNHPILLALVGAATVAPAVRACQGELLAGTLDVTLAGPVSRRRYLVAYALHVLVGTVVLSVVAWASIVGFLALLDVPGSIAAADAAWACLNAAAMFLTFAGIGLFASVLLGRVGNAMFVTVGVLVVMYALTFAERLWNADLIQFLGPVSVFHWFDPGPTLGGADVPVRDVLVPLCEAIALFAASMWRFERRDL